MLELGPDNFSGTRILDLRNILAVFYAEWCPFCRSFLSLFEKTMKDKTIPLGGEKKLRPKNYAAQTTI